MIGAGVFQGVSDSLKALLSANIAELADPGFIKYESPHAVTPGRDKQDLGRVSRHTLPDIADLRRNRSAAALRRLWTR